jgi:hypothetical protein
MNYERSIANLHAWLREHESITATDPGDAWMYALSRDGHAACLVSRTTCRPCLVADALSKLVIEHREQRVLQPVVDLRAQLRDGSRLAKDLELLTARTAATRAFVERGPVVRPHAPEILGRLAALAHELDALRSAAREVIADALPDRDLGPAGPGRPKKILLREVEFSLHCAKFTDGEIAKLIDDGEGGTKQHKLDRIFRRREAYLKDDWWTDTKVFADLMRASGEA